MPYSNGEVVYVVRNRKGEIIGRVRTDYRSRGQAKQKAIEEWGNDYYRVEREDDGD